MPENILFIISVNIRRLNVYFLRNKLKKGGVYSAGLGLLGSKRTHGFNHG